MNSVVGQHSQPQSLLNTSTISGSAGIADHNSGTGSSVGSSDAEVMVNEDAQEWIPDADHELKRVKVC